MKTDSQHINKDKLHDYRFKACYLDCSYNQHHSDCDDGCTHGIFNGDFCDKVNEEVDSVWDWL